MNDVPPGVPRRGGGRAADRLREQLEREFGTVPPEEDRPDPAGNAEQAAGTDTDAAGTDTDAAGTDTDAAERKSPHEQ